MIVEYNSIKMSFSKMQNYVVLLSCCKINESHDINDIARAMKMKLTSMILKQKQLCCQCETKTGYLKIAGNYGRVFFNNILYLGIFLLKNVFFVRLLHNKYVICRR